MSAHPNPSKPSGPPSKKQKVPVSVPEVDDKQLEEHHTKLEEVQDRIDKLD